MSNVVRLVPSNGPVISVTTRSVYGVERIYPANAEAEILCRIAGTKTLTLENLVDARALGMQVHLLSAPVDGVGKAVRDLSKL